MYDTKAGARRAPLGRGAVCAPAIGAWTYQGMVWGPHARCQKGSPEEAPCTIQKREPGGLPYQGSVWVVYEDTVRRLDVRY